MLLLGFSSSKARIFTVLTVVSAVSAEEKNAESIKSSRRIASCMTPGVSKKTTPLIKNCADWLFI